MNETNQIPSDETVHQAFEDWLYAMYAKDQIMDAFKAGYRLGYRAGNKNPVDQNDEREE